MEAFAAVAPGLRAVVRTPPYQGFLATAWIAMLQALTARPRGNWRSNPALLRNLPRSTA
jgi:hypothetical protein